QTNSGGQLVRSILQLLEEWEYHFAGPTNQAVRSMMAKHVDVPYPNSTLDDNDPAARDPDQVVVARLFKFNNEIAYEHLLTPRVPLQLDYIEVMFSMCDVLCLIYNKFMDEECYGGAAVFEALVKVDGKFKHHLLNVTAKEFTDMSINIVKAELHSIR
ncbi:unnamed protein product, partial [Phaeothamnion confervicola]